MLDALRKGTASILVKVLLGLLIVSFAVWGIGDIFISPAQNPRIASVGGQDITASEFITAYQRELNELSQQAGRPITAEQAREVGLIDQTIREMLSRTILSRGAKESDIAIGDAVVRGDIVANPAFQTPTGRFDRLGFEQLLRSNGLTEASYVESRRQDLAREQLITSVAVGTFTPKVMVEPLFKYRLETRVADIVLVAPANVPAPPAPLEMTLAAFHQENASRYTAPEYRAVSYLLITPESLFAEIAVNEQQLRTDYENRAAEFTTVETREVEQLLFDTADKAKAAHARAQKGDAFETIAKESESLNVGATSLGSVTQAELPPEIAAQVFALAAGAVSDAVKSAFGWHVFKVEKVNQGGTAPFEQVRDQIEKHLKRDKAVDVLFQLSNRLEDEMAGGATLEEAAAKANQTVVTFAALDRFGRDPKGEAAADVPERSAFLNQVFSLPVGRTSPPLETNDGALYFVRVDAITPPVLRPLDTIKEQVERDWRRVQTARATAAVGKEIEAAVKGGKAPADVASERKLTNRKTPALTRTSGLADPEVSAELVTLLFAAKVGDLVSAATPVGDGYVVARLETINEASPEERAVPLAQLRDQLNRALGADILYQYQLALESRLRVSVYRERLEALDLNTAARGYTGGRRF